jgi:hypothetical protein
VLIRRCSFELVLQSRPFSFPMALSHDEESPLGMHCWEHPLGMQWTKEASIMPSPCGFTLHFCQPGKNYDLLLAYYASKGVTISSYLWSKVVCWLCPQGERLCNGGWLLHLVSPTHCSSCNSSIQSNKLLKSEIVMNNFQILKINYE